ncbi:hypothetical protein PHMEG_00029108 [Phytophthora megakarya]|uniref:Uncharacterized protein n=1 Tax=Phytophthora megakarya TaxID=4795 RepID=A0A225V1T9_9STRA|nr:hypothetical protein PHMEG_00029108 [Phytophthora megakarya]
MEKICWMWSPQQFALARQFHPTRSHRSLLLATKSVLLRRTSALGAKYCGLQDTCYVFTYNLVFVVAIASLVLGLVAGIFTLLLKLYKKCHPGVSTAGLTGEDGQPAKQQLTSFETNCLGVPFTIHFKDCDDFAYTMYMGKRYSTVEDLLLTRVLPRKMIRTFNQLFLRWHIDPSAGKLSYPLSCPWYGASAENYKISEATPLV